MQGERKLSKDSQKTNTPDKCSFCGQEIIGFVICAKSTVTDAKICDSCIVQCGDKLIEKYQQIIKAAGE